MGLLFDEVRLQVGHQVFGPHKWARSEQNRAAQSNRAIPEAGPGGFKDRIEPLGGSGIRRTVFEERCI